MITIGDLSKRIASQLAPLSDSPELDAQVLLADSLKKSRTWLAAHPESHPTKGQLASVEKALTRLESGEPLPYVLGHREFFGLEFDLTPDVLIPRPETELMVERALEWSVFRRNALSIADVGTGSGCIAVALAKNIPQAKILATDISRPALEIARRNAIKHGVEHQINFIQCDLLPSHPQPLQTESRFSLICANLPYIPTETLKGLDVYGREPTLALNGGDDGLNIVRRLVDIAPEWLAPKGMILLEIEDSQGMAAVSLAYDAFDNAEIRLHQDLASYDRLVEIIL